MLRQPPVDISLLLQVSVELVQNFLGAIPIFRIETLPPLLIQGYVYSGIAVNTQQRVIENAESPRVLIHIGRRAHMLDVIPFASGIDLVADHPVHHLAVSCAGITAGQERRDRRNRLRPAPICGIESKVGRMSAGTRLRMNQLRMRGNII